MSQLVPVTTEVPVLVAADGDLRPVAARRRRPLVSSGSDRGVVSAEWAMVIIAAVAIVGVLVTVLTSGPIQEVLLELIKKIIGGALTGI